MNETAINAPFALLITNSFFIYFQSCPPLPKELLLKTKNNAKKSLLLLLLFCNEKCLGLLLLLNDAYHKMKHAWFFLVFFLQFLVFQTRYVLSLVPIVCFQGGFKKAHIPYLSLTVTNEPEFRRAVAKMHRWSVCRR